MNPNRSDTRLLEKTLEERERKKGLLKTGAELAGGTALSFAGGAAAAKFLPYLSEFMPIDLAVKGISKYSPKLGKILKNAPKYGFDTEEVLGYLRENSMPSGEDQQQEISPIQKYSEKLFSFLKEQIGGGRSPLEAGALAQNMKEFMQPIQKMQKDLQRNWSDILTEEFGEGVMNKEPSQQQPQESNNWEDSIIQKMQALRNM